ncbi:hypothetical protein [Paenarthrobacter nicotinovorans]|uniref:hypothetical protein n=1 Tax=Paenarthrobacter nicotinovorans TaxID=29320 RepID=UPI000478B418|nr:hypothetical protein [Paenarthrobacter nicotinovorans]
MADATAGQVTHTADQVQVEVAGSSALAGEARQVFNAAVSAYASELLNEASRRELEHRADTSEIPQFTSAQVAIAERVVRSRGLALPRRSRWFIAAKISLYVFAVAVGISSNMMLQTNPWGLDVIGWVVVLCVSATAALAITIVTEVIEFNRGR